MEMARTLGEKSKSEVFKEVRRRRVENLRMTFYHPVLLLFPIRLDVEKGADAEVQRREQIGCRNPAVAQHALRRRSKEPAFGEGGAQRRTTRVSIKSIEVCHRYQA